MAVRSLSADKILTGFPAVILYLSTDFIDLVATHACLLYTSDAADERSSVDLGGRRIIKKKNTLQLIRFLLYTSITLYHPLD